MFNPFILEPLLRNIDTFGDRNAFCINENFYTYSDFAESISKIRTALQQQPPAVKNVGLVANDDLETYAAIFALWLEGYAYVPLHPAQPPERNLEIISQAHIELVIASNDQPVYNAFRTINTATLIFEGMNLTPSYVSDDALAYILFTSGSTGKPKGVPITRNNLGGFMKAFWKTGITIDETDRCLQAYEMTFDLSVQSYLVPLTKGACTYTVPHEVIKYSYVFGLMDDHALTFTAMPPSLIRYLRPYFDEIDVPAMRYCLLGAEASAVDLIAEWADCIPNAEIYNFYGPTEATIYCTYYRFPTDGTSKNLNGLMAIGKPMNGITALIVGENQQLLATGEKGELCISGEQLTQGYWENPEKNSEVFINIETEGKQERFYKTGDLCFKDADGDIMYSGRMDYQVKIQGYRIELGEIEHHAREFLQGQNAIAVTFEGVSQNTELALFVEGELANPDALVAHLKTKIPAYMIPAKILSRDIFPVNNSGKIDRIILKNTLN